MNAIDFAVNEVKRKIPAEILYAAMTYGEDPNLVALSSLEEKLTLQIIRKRVLLTCNVIGGIKYFVPISQINPTYFENMYTVYRIPPEMIMHKQIISALMLAYMPLSGMNGGLNSGYAGNGAITAPGAPDMFSHTPLMNVASRIGSAAGANGVLTNTNLELVAHNTVAVYANYRTLSNFGMWVMLENDSNLNNLPPRSYQMLGRLCELATKSYIYNKLIIPINSGYLLGGQDLGVFKSIIEGYSSAEEDYQTYLTEVWGKVLFHSDNKRMSDYIGSMFAPDL